MSQQYEEAYMEVMEFQHTDVITASGDEIIDNNDEVHGWVPK